MVEENLTFCNPIDYEEFINTQDYLVFYNSIVYEGLIGEE